MPHSAPRPAAGGPPLPWLTALVVGAAMLTGWPVFEAQAAEQAPPPEAPPEEPTAPSQPVEEGEAPVDPAMAPPPGAVVRGPRTSLGIDLNVEGAFGWIPERESFTGFGRGRVGLLVFIDPPDPRMSPLAVSTGLTYEASNLSAATLGVQTEIIHMSSGVWGQAGALVDVTTPSPGMMVALGWSIVGLEVQRRFYDVDHEPSDGLNAWGLYAKLRVPISIIMRAF